MEARVETVLNSDCASFPVIKSSLVYQKTTDLERQSLKGDTLHNASDSYMEVLVGLLVVEKVVSHIGSLSGTGANPFLPSLRRVKVSHYSHTIGKSSDVRHIH